MKKEEKIYLDKEGYEKFLKDIEDVRKQLTNNGKNKSEAYESAVGDGWHDNFAFEDAKREEFRLMGTLRDMLEKLNRIVIIDKAEKIEDDTIDIGNIVTIEMCFNDEEPEEMEFKLVASESTNKDTKITEISINSPLGQAVYQNKVGHSGAYKVGDNKTSFTILNNGKSNDNHQKNVKSLKRKK